MISYCVLAIPPHARDPNQGCRRRERLYAQQTIINPNNEILSSFTLECTNKTTFEVRFADETLCRCGRIVRTGVPFSDNCIKKSNLDFWVVISVPNVLNRFGENCTFRFTFADGVVLTLPLGIPPGKIVTSSFNVSGVSTRFLTSYVTSTVFFTSTASPTGQPSTTSSFMQVANSPTSSAGKIRLVVLAVGWCWQYKITNRKII
jgi:hypothetical protein